MNLEDLKVYQMAMAIGEKGWGIVTRWDYFAKDTVGKQLVRSVDSVAANLSEGFGRFSYKENVQFCYYARGSLYESKTWLAKGKNRKLVKDEEFNMLTQDIETTGKMLNAYIKSIGKQPVTNDQ